MYDIRKELIESALSDGSLNCNIIVFDEVDSTNNIAKQMAAQGIEDKTLIVANRQTAGRGRLGRSFLSPGGGIYLSIILRPEFSPEQILKLTTGASVAVRRVISEYCDNAKIKWVNDIYISQKKVCGILAESATDKEGSLSYVIVGIGINVFGRSGDYGKELESVVTTLEENTFTQLDKNIIIANVYNEILDIYSSLENFENVIKEYKQHSIVIGKEVYMINGNNKRKIKVTDIDADGAILAIDCKSGNKIRVSSGEVSIRFN